MGIWQSTNNLHMSYVLKYSFHMFHLVDGQIVPKKIEPRQHEQFTLWKFNQLLTPLYHVIENTANQNTGKPLYTIDVITPKLPIVHCFECAGHRIFYGVV